MLDDYVMLPSICHFPLAAHAAQPAGVNPRQLRKTGCCFLLIPLSNLVPEHAVAHMKPKLLAYCAHNMTCFFLALLFFHDTPGGGCRSSRLLPTLLLGCTLPPAAELASPLSSSSLLDGSAGGSACQAIERQLQCHSFRSFGLSNHTCSLCDSTDYIHRCEGERDVSRLTMAGCVSTINTCR
jgi:hypothetical protein